MNWCKIGDFIMTQGDVCIAVASLVATVIIFRKTMQRDKKLATLKMVYEMRKAFPEVQNLNKAGVKRYLQRMEFLCTGINEGIYDLKIMRKVSGKLFLSQYEEVKKYIVEKRNSGKQSEDIYIEYEKVMKKLQCFYNCKGCLWCRIKYSIFE